MEITWTMERVELLHRRFAERFATSDIGHPIGLTKIRPSTGCTATG